MAGLALLIALAALAGSAYQWYMSQQAPAPQADGDAWRSELQRVSTEQNSRYESLKEDVGGARQQIADTRVELDSEIEQLSRDSLALLNQVSEMGRTDRDDWQLAEVEYLLRMAHQRVVMGAELKSAASLLANADKILNGLNMAGLHVVRKQLARDLVAVRAAAELDSEGLYLRLQALQDQAGSLLFFGMPKIEAPAAEVDNEDDSWKSQLSQNWERAATKVKTLVVVQKRDGGVEPLLSEAWQALVRERLGLELSQASSAVVLQQEAIYQRALTNAQQIIERHFLADQAATVAILAELDALLKESIVSDLPDISGSQEAIRGYIDQKYRAQEQLAPIAAGEAVQ